MKITNTNSNENTLVVSDHELLMKNEIGNKNQLLLELLEEEAIISEGYETFFRSGMALANIRDKGLFKGKGYRRFDEYVAEEWEMKGRYAYYLINAARTRKSLPPPPLSGIPDSGVKEWTESSINPLTKLDPKFAEKVGKKAVAKVEKSYKAAEKHYTPPPAFAPPSL